jgi:hypothetical protein
MIFLSLSGKKQAGKSTVIDFLKKQLMSDYAVVNFADALKIVVVQCFVPAGTVPKGVSSIAWAEDHKDFFLSNVNITVRAMLQFFGTEIMRGIWSETWINAWKNRIQQTAASQKFLKYILVSDVRFMNEVDAVRALGGRIIRLTRNPHPDDGHSSETELDGYEIAEVGRPSVFDAVVDNSNLTIDQTNQKIWKIIDKEGWLDK